MSEIKPGGAEVARRYRPAQRLTALVYGVVCHSLFTAAILAMALSLFSGMRLGRGPFRGLWAVVANLCLLVSFPAAHSWLLSARGRRAMSRTVPLELGKELSTTVFAALSSLLLLAVFLFWSPSGIVWWQAHGWIAGAIGIAAAASWLLLAKSMADAQLSVQTGFLGWSSVFRNRVPTYEPFATRGMYRHVRQSIYISFTLLLWLSAVWTPDQLVLAVLWTGYCVAGAALKERRCQRYFGDAFRQYQVRVPFWIPFRSSSADPVATDRPVSTALSGHGPAPGRGRAPPADTHDADVLIVGAGPIGLCLANLLGRRGRRVLVIERRMQMPAGSLAIGITPPSLAVFKSLGLDQEFTRRGIPIDRARVFEDGVPLGDVDFSRIPADHRFILSLPQSTTLAVLRENLREYPLVRILEGVELVGYTQDAHRVRAELRDVRSGAHSTVRTAYLAGCDGHRSAVRRLAGAGWREHSYRPRFLMADFEDNTTLGQEAHLYFGRNGSVESFPLPGGRRRWIVQTHAVPAKDAMIPDAVAQAVADRTGVDLSTSQAHFRSWFRPRRGLARRYAWGRVVLCGDAAHVMSPIGGQGMNTGFADAAHLDRALAAVLDGDAHREAAWDTYERERKRAFRVAADRAACGMWLGTRRGSLFSTLRRAFIGRILLRPSIRERLAPYFAMLTIPGVSEVSPSAVTSRRRRP